MSPKVAFQILIVCGAVLSGSGLLVLLLPFNGVSGVAFDVVGGVMAAAGLFLLSVALVGARRGGSN